MERKIEIALFIVLLTAKHPDKYVKYMGVLK
jgi:hypothetical protein